VIAAQGLPVQVACRVLGVSEVGYYGQLSRPPSERVIRHAWLTDLITRVHADSRGTYGGLRVHAELTLGQGLIVGHNRIAMLMSRAGLAGVTGRRKWKRSPTQNLATDLVDRCFARTGPNQFWVTDITEHPTREGKVYCCVWLDTYSRRVVGWSIDSCPTAALVTNALGMAIDSRRPAEGGLIHSDHGTQGEFNWSSQHLDMEVSDGTTARMDDHGDGSARDAIAWQAADPPRCRARVLGEDCRGAHQRGRGGRVRRVGSGRIAMVPGAWWDVLDPARSVVGQVSVLH
jgi:hypothetical protein